MMDIARGVEHPHRVERRQDRTASENDLIVRLKRAEEALRTRDLSFRLIVDSIPTPVAVTTPSGEIEGVNQPALEYFDKTLEELKGWKASDVIHPDDLQHTIDAMIKAHETGQAFNVESRHRRADGIYRWFNVLGLPLRDSEGEILCWFHLLIDIDGRKRAEAQLAGEKRLLEMVASNCPLTDVLTALCKFVEDTSSDCYCGVYLIDWSGSKFRIGAVPSLPATFNDPVDGLTVSPQVGPCGVAALTKTQVIATDLESDPLWQSSAIRPLALAHGLRSHWSTPIYAQEGRVLGTFAIFNRVPASPTQIQQDLIAQVTHIASIAIERALSEAALKRSEAFLAEAQHLSRIGSFAWRVATNEITWSEQLYRIFEFDPQVTVSLELIGTRVHPEDLTLLQDMIERASSAASDFQYEHRLLMPDHSVKYLHMIAHGTQNEDGELEYIGAVQDVTNRQLSEEALGKARSELAHVARVRSLGALTASIAHEVNQPLSGIITNANTCLRMLAADPPNVDGARETARRTLRDGDRASDVVTRLRALFSRKELTLESLDLNQAAREVIALSWSDLQRSRVIVRAELAEDLPLVMGDRVQLQQVILNLLLNAADAMSGGMGIGLSISRSIIENHGGRLWARPNDGPGVTFAFSVPYTSEGEPAAP